MESSKIGKNGEEAVCNCLRRRGCRIIRQNFRIPGGEIDIIAEAGEYLVFVEVKTRKENALSSGFDAITPRKQKLLLKTATAWLSENPTTLQPRFDVACVTMRDGKALSVQYVTNAFDATESEFCWF